VTKLVTTLMLFKLRDAGMLSLDDPIHVHDPLPVCVLNSPNVNIALFGGSCAQLYVPQLKWASPFKGNPGITWRSLAGQTRYDLRP
jgi:hypothetical protein